MVTLMPKGQFIVDRVKTLEDGKSLWMDYWQQLGDYFLPYRANFINRLSVGEAFPVSIITDSTPTYSLMLLISALYSNLIGTAMRSLTFRHPGRKVGKNAKVREWSYESSQIIKSLLLKSNMTPESIEALTDIALYGTGVLYCEEDAKRVVYFTTIPLRQVCLEQNTRKEVDVVHRKYDLTYAQMMEDFGHQNLSSDVQRQLHSSSGIWDDKATVIHSVFPRTRFSQFKWEHTQLEWVSLYVENATGHVLSEKGYHENPYIVSRWSQYGEEVFGRSIAMLALPHTKTLYEMIKTVLEAGNKAVDPPTGLEPGLIQGMLDLSAGAVNKINPNARPSWGIKRLYDPSGLPFGYQLIENFYVQLGRLFYNDQFQIMPAEGRTATEALLITQANMRLTAPIMSRQDTEMVRPLFDLVFRIALRTGSLPPVPDILEEQKGLYLDYISPIERAQRLDEVQSITQALELSAKLGQVFPEIWDKWNADRVVDEINDVLGVSPYVLNSDVEKRRLRESRSKQNESAQNAAALQQLADIKEKEARSVRDEAFAEQALSK